MKFVITILSFIQGAFMLVDGIHVILKGKYIGPPEPGPWAILFTKLGVDVFKLGPLFIVFGAAWLIFLYALITGQQWGFKYGIIISILTLWYLPVGTIISVIVLLALFFARTKLFP